MGFDSKWYGSVDFKNVADFLVFECISPVSKPNVVCSCHSSSEHGSVESPLSYLVKYHLISVVSHHSGCWVKTCGSFVSITCILSQHNFAHCHYTISSSIALSYCVFDRFGLITFAFWCCHKYGGMTGGSLSQILSPISLGQGRMTSHELIFKTD